MYVLNEIPAEFMSEYIRSIIASKMKQLIAEAGIMPDISDMPPLAPIAESSTLPKKEIHPTLIDIITQEALATSRTESQPFAGASK
jgi:hypothetical protein